MARQWYMAVGGHQVGPVSEEEIRQNLENGTIDASTLLFAEGMGSWTALRDVPEFRAGASRPSGPGTPPPVPGRRAHEIEGKIYGEDLQFVEISLDPGESVVAEAGAMMYMTPGVEMETVFGDASGQGQGGVWGALMGAGKRLLTGESLFMTVFTNRGSGVNRVAFAAP